MHVKVATYLILALLSVAGISPAWAQEAQEAQENDAVIDDSQLYEEEVARSWIASIEFGFLLTSGNTENNSLKAKVDATQDLPKWRNTYQAEAFSSSDDETTTAERYRASAKSDYKLFEDKRYLFARLAAVDDRFTGYEYEVTSSIGYGFRAWEHTPANSTDSAFLDLEAGPGYRFAKIRREQLEAGEDDMERAGIVRVAGLFQYPLSDHARFSQTLSSEFGVAGDDNVIAEAQSALAANLVDGLAMKLAFDVRYVKEPPRNSKSTDTETSITLIYTL